MMLGAALFTLAWVRQVRFLRHGLHTKMNQKISGSDPQVLSIDTSHLVYLPM